MHNFREFQARSQNASSVHSLLIIALSCFHSHHMHILVLFHGALVPSAPIPLALSTHLTDSNHATFHFKPSGWTKICIMQINSASYSFYYRTSLGPTIILVESKRTLSSSRCSACHGSFDSVLLKPASRSSGGKTSPTGKSRIWSRNCQNSHVQYASCPHAADIIRQQISIATWRGCASLYPLHIVIPTSSLSLLELHHFSLNYILHDQT